jgi:hypothetical protein
MAHSPRRRDISKLRTCASSSSARVCICVACACAGSAESTWRNVESAAVVWASASWQRARRRSVLVCGWGGAGATGAGAGAGAGVDGVCLDLDLDLDLDFVGVGGVLVLGVEGTAGTVGAGMAVWRVLASWQSASAARKRLMAMYAAARLVRYAGSVETRSRCDHYP